MGTITSGIEKLEVSVDQGTTWQQLGLTTLDSTELDEADGETTDHYVEELDDALASYTTKGKTSLTWEIANPNLETYMFLFGGTITGTAPNQVWNAPALRTVKEVMVRSTPKVGYITTFNRVILKPKMSTSLGKKSLQVIAVEADILTPTDGVTGPLTMGPEVA